MTGDERIPVGVVLPADLCSTPDDLVAAVHTAHAAGVAHVVLVDRPVPRRGGAAPPAAVLLAALLAVRTSGIGIVVGASTAYHEPYNLARMIASLDHLSGGRAGWWASSASDPVAAANHPELRGDGSARAVEHVAAVRALWDSWEDGAFVHDKATGRFVDPDRVHPIDHVGRELSVRGPLNVIRPPQGQPVILTDAHEPLAGVADLVAAGTAPAGGTARLLSVRPFVGPTATALHAAAGAPRSTPEHLVVVGEPGAVADELRERARGTRGLVARFTDTAALTAFLDGVAPHLVPATPEPAVMLRARLGLPVPENMFAAAGRS